ncbi:MAG: SLBB domain-containing protein, partial [Chloroflexota bacterium]|nr:SLBB domain-containing protein [Chloroflexota bacterium]
MRAGQRIAQPQPRRAVAGGERRAGAIGGDGGLRLALEGVDIAAGAEWPRVRLWSVSGAVAKPGCYEAPVDITARQLIDDHAGGATEEIGSVVPGGAASGIIPPAALDAPLTREGLAPWGSGPGSAGLQVFPASYGVL